MEHSEQITKHLSKDPVLAPLIRDYSIPQPHPDRDVYKYLLESIVSQQLSFKVAMVIFDRFLELFPGRYPDPEQVLNSSDEVLRETGLSRSKIRYMKNVADFYLNGQLRPETLEQYSDKEVIKHLIQVKGVGKWTAEMILMFPLGRDDVFPLDDLGIQNVMKSLYGLEEQGKPLRERLTAIADQWSPYRTWACKYLWNYSDGG